VFEEALETVKTVRDFSEVFEAYSEFEQTTLEHMMENMSDDPTEDESLAMELRMAR
jgi:pre-mRNA-splicing factor SYF1